MRWRIKYPLFLLMLVFAMGSFPKAEVSARSKRLMPESQQSLNNTPSNQASGQNQKIANSNSNNSIHYPALSYNQLITRANTMSYFLKDAHLQEIMKNYTPWQSVSNSMNKGKMNTDYQRYGFYPFWNDNKGLKIDFNLYSRIGYYAALPDMLTGKIKDSFNWNKIDIKLAHEYGCKVDLVLVGFMENEKPNLPENTDAVKSLISEMLGLVKQAGGDGVTLDFGYLEMQDKKTFALIVQELSKGLEAINESHKLNCMLPPIISNKSMHFEYDFEDLNKYIDYYLLTGFDYNAINSGYASPNAPLNSGSKWSNHNVNESTFNYLSFGVPKEKLILVVPYFGKKWMTHDMTIPSKAKGQAEFISYNDFVSTIKPGSNRIFDKESSTACFTSRIEGQSLQTWIDDSLSLSFKYNYIIQNNFAGVGIWALGYDQGYQKLTHALINSFSGMPVNKGILNYLKGIIMKMIGFFSGIGKIEKILWSINTILVLFFLVILLISFKVCSIRSMVNKFIFLFYGLGIGLFVSTYFLLRQTEHIDDDGTLAIAGFIVIACLIWVKRMKDSNARKGYP